MEDASSIYQQYTQNKGALVELAKLGVQLFGVQLSPTGIRSSTTSLSNSTLVNLVAGRQGHVLALTLEELSQYAITGLCSRTRPFGTSVSRNGTSLLCSTYTSFDACSTDAKCSWDAASLTCESTACLQHCGESACRADAYCAFSNGMCAPGLCVFDCIDLCVVIHVHLQ